MARSTTSNDKKPGLRLAVLGLGAILTGFSPVASGACNAVKSFKSGVWSSVLGTRCYVCHSESGQARSTRMAFRAANSDDNDLRNLTLTKEIAAQRFGSLSLLVAKATGQTNHSGGAVVGPTSAEANALAAFANAMPDTSGCDSSTTTTTTTKPPILEIKNRRDSSPTRRLRRAALAVLGRLPSLSEYDQVRSGAASYEQLVDRYLSEQGSRTFANRLQKVYLRRLINGIVPDVFTLESQGVGRGVAFRLKGNTLGPPHIVVDVPAACVTPPDQTFGFVQRWGATIPTTYNNCVLEAPAKQQALALRRVFLPNNHPYKRYWVLKDFYPQNARDYRAVSNDFWEALPEGKPFERYDARFSAGNFFNFKINIGEQNGMGAVNPGYSMGRAVPSPEDAPEMWRPGWFTGCKIPTEAAVTQNDFDSWTAPNSGIQPRVDTAGYILHPDAYPAVKVTSWWGGDVWVCPGLAIQEAVEQGVISHLPSYYRRNSANSDVSEFLWDYRVPDTQEGKPIRQWVRDNYPKYVTENSQKVLKPRTSDDYELSVLFNTTYNNRAQGQWAQASASVYDTMFNPLADCGKNLRYCNPLYDWAEISASYEAQVLFQKIVESKRPYRDFLSGPIRVTNRALEWLLHHRQLEGEEMRRTGSVQVKATGIAMWLPSGTWAAPDPMPRLSSLPALANTAWEFQSTNPTKYNRNEGEPEFASDWDKTFVLTDQSNGMPMTGVLSTTTFLNDFAPNRGRANHAKQFFTCEGFPLALSEFKIAPEEIGKPPREQVKSGCAGCHASGGVDPYANHFMEYSGDGTNNNFAAPSAAQPKSFRGMGYVAAQKAIERDPAGFYGKAPGGGVDEWQGVPVTAGLFRLAQILGQEPNFTRCTITSMWQALLSRAPADEESRYVDQLVAQFQGKNYSLQDIARAILLSEPVRKDP